MQLDVATAFEINNYVAMQLSFVLEMCIMHFLFTMCMQYKKDIKRVLFKKLRSLSDLLFLIGEQETDMIKATVSSIYILSPQYIQIDSKPAA